MTDKDLKQNVERALDWEPSLDASDIGVSVDEGVATLRGNVASYGTELAKVSPMPQGITERLTRIKAEYEEMPGLSLTAAQAERLFGLDAVACAAILDALVDVGFLVRNERGLYTRATSGPSRTPYRPVTAITPPEWCTAAAWSRRQSC